MCIFLFKGDYYYIYFFPSGKYMAWLGFFYLFHLNLSFFFSSWRCQQLGGCHRLVPADDRLWSWSRPDLRLWKNRVFTGRGVVTKRDKTWKWRCLGCKRVNRKNGICVFGIWMSLESIACIRNGSFLLHIWGRSHILVTPGVKACCALVDAWGSKGEAQKAAEILEELEAWRGWLIYFWEVFILGFFSFFFGIFFLFGPLVPWSSNPLVPWSSRPPSSRPLIVWSPVPWTPGPLVPWSPGPLVPCSSGLLVPWSSVLFRSFFSNLSFTLFYYQFYIFTLSDVC